MVDIIVARRSVFPLGGEAHIGIGHLVAGTLFVVLPYAGVLESPEGVEGIACDIAVHAVRIVSRRIQGGDEIFGADVEHHLIVVRNREGGGPLELLGFNVTSVKGKLDALVGNLAEVHHMVVEARLLGHLNLEEKVGSV